MVSGLNRSCNRSVIRHDDACNTHQRRGSIPPRQPKPQLQSLKPPRRQKVRDAKRAASASEVGRHAEWCNLHRTVRSLELDRDVQPSREVPGPDMRRRGAAGESRHRPTP